MDHPFDMGINPFILDVEDMYDHINPDTCPNASHVRTLAAANNVMYRRVAMTGCFGTSHTYINVPVGNSVPSVFTLLKTLEELAHDDAFLDEASLLHAKIVSNFQHSRNVLSNARNGGHVRLAEALLKKNHRNIDQEIVESISACIICDQQPCVAGEAILLHAYEERRDKIAICRVCWTDHIDHYFHDDSSPPLLCPCCNENVRENPCLVRFPIKK